MAEPISATTLFLINLAITATTTGFSAYAARKRRRKQIREGAETILEVRPSGSGEDVGIPYGFCAVPMTVVRSMVGQNIPASATAYVGALGNINGYAGTGAFAGVLGDERNPHLMLVGTVGTDEIDHLLDVWIDDRSIRTNIEVRQKALAILGNPGASTEFERIFVPSEANLQFKATDRFLRKSHVAVVMWQDQDNPLFDAGIVNRPPTCFLKGRRLKSVDGTGTGNARTYALSATDRFRNNAVNVRLDYILSQHYGPQGIDFSDFSQAARKTWHDAQQIAGRVVKGAVPNSEKAMSDGGTLPADGNAPTQDIATQTVPVPSISLSLGIIDFTTGGENFRTWGMNNNSTGWRSTTPTTGISTSSVRGSYSSSTPLRLYEFNGAVRTANNFLNVQEVMLEVMPGAVEYEDHEGFLRMSLVDPFDSRTEEQMVTATFDEDVTMPETIVEEWPDNNDRANEYHVSFADSALDFAKSDVIWPTPGSALATQLLALDNGRKLIATLELEGCCDEYHAYSLAANYCLLSRRKLYSWDSTWAMFDVAPGDVVRLKNDRLNINAVVRILEKSIGPVLSWRAVEFKKLDYGWYPEPDQTIESLKVQNLSIPAPTNCVAAYDDETGYISISWTNVPSLNISSYEVQHDSDQSGTTWATVSIVSEGESSAVYAADFGVHSHTFRVRALGVNGGHSTWATSSAISVMRVGEQFNLETFSQGTCPVRTRGFKGDKILDAVNGIIWENEGNVFDETEGSNGVLLATTSFSASTTTRYVSDATFVVPSKTPPALQSIEFSVPAGMTLLADFATSGTATLRFDPDNPRGERYRKLSFGFRYGLALTEVEVSIDSIDDTIVLTGSSLTSEWVTLATAVAVERRWSMLILDDLLRCPDDPFNPWVPKPLSSRNPSVGFEILYSLAASTGAVQASEIPPDSLPYLASNSSVRIFNNAVMPAAGRRWYNQEQQTTSSFPYLAVIVRQVPGLPSTGDVPNLSEGWGAWAGPVYRKTWSADGTDGAPGLDANIREEIWTASPVADLAANQLPLASWTYRQIFGAATIERNGVIWAGNLSAAGFSEGKEFGIRAVREAPHDAESGDAISFAWSVQTMAHYGMPANVFLQTKYEYTSISTVSVFADGQYAFFKGTAKITNGNWADIKASLKLEVSSSDKHSIYALGWEDLSEGDTIVFAPTDDQWVAFKITASPALTPALDAYPATYVFAVEKDREYNGPAANVSATGDVDFFLSVPLRGKPGPLRSREVYNGARQTARWDGQNGYFRFYKDSTYYTTNLRNVLESATHLSLAPNDENGNENTALEATETGDFILAEVFGTNLWAAWRILEIDFTEGNYVLSIKLWAYHLPVGNAGTYERNFDMAFYFSAQGDPTARTLDLTLAPIADVAEGVTSVPYSFVLTGTLLESTALGDLGINMQLRVDDQTPSREIYSDPTGLPNALGGPQDGWNVSVPVVVAEQPELFRGTGTIEIPSRVSKSVFLLLTLIVYRGGIRRTENEGLTVIDNPSLGADNLPIMDPPIVTGGPSSILVAARSGITYVLNPFATSWWIRRRALGEATWTTASATPRVPFSWTDVVNGATYEVQQRQGVGATRISEWSDSALVTPNASVTLSVDIPSISDVRAGSQATLSLSATLGGNATGSATYAWSVMANIPLVIRNNRTATPELVIPASLGRLTSLTVRIKVEVVRGGVTATGVEYMRILAPAPLAGFSATLSTDKTSVDWSNEDVVFTAVIVGGTHPFLMQRQYMHNGAWVNAGAVVQGVGMNRTLTQTAFFRARGPAFAVRPYRARIRDSQGNDVFTNTVNIVNQDSFQLTIIPLQTMMAAGPAVPLRFTASGAFTGAITNVMWTATVGTLANPTSATTATLTPNVTMGAIGTLTLTATRGGVTATTSIEYTILGSGGTTLNVELERTPSGDTVSGTRVNRRVRVVYNPVVSGTAFGPMEYEWTPGDSGMGLPAPLGVLMPDVGDHEFIEVTREIEVSRSSLTASAENNVYVVGPNEFINYFMRVVPPSGTVIHEGRSVTFNFDTLMRDDFVIRRETFSFPDGFDNNIFERTNLGIVGRFSPTRRRITLRRAATAVGTLNGVEETRNVSARATYTYDGMIITITKSSTIYNSREVTFSASVDTPIAGTDVFSWFARIPGPGASITRKTGNPVTFTSPATGRQWIVGVNVTRTGTGADAGKTQTDQESDTFDIITTSGTLPPYAFGRDNTTAIAYGSTILFRLGNAAPLPAVPTTTNVSWFVTVDGTDLPSARVIPGPPGTTEIDDWITLRIYMPLTGSTMTVGVVTDGPPLGSRVTTYSLGTMELSLSGPSQISISSSDEIVIALSEVYPTGAKWTSTITTAAYVNGTLTTEGAFTSTRSSRFQLPSNFRWSIAPNFGGFKVGSNTVRITFLSTNTTAQGVSYTEFSGEATINITGVA